MNLKSNYNETDPLSIELYSKKLIGKTFEDVLSDYFQDNYDDYIRIRELFNNPFRKGSLGNLIEEYFFGYTPNSSPEPDFPEAGVELKVTPYEVTKTGKVRAGERLVLGMIPNNEPVSETFFNSSAFKKLELMLLILYFRDKELDRVNHPIHYSQLVSLHSEILRKDLEIIKSDYEIIAGKIKSGRAHELSEADTMYLGAATKGSTAEKSYQEQYYNPSVKAKRRAYSLKQGYMTSFINKYILEEAKTYDYIVNEPVSKETFESIVISKLNSHKGMSEKELRRKYGLEASNSKAILSQLVLRILDVRTDNAEEFDKSNTQVKTIRIEEDGSIIENMSFPSIKFKEFVNEEWEDSQLFKYFSETRFLFVTFKNRNGTYYLDESFFWNMPFKDLNNDGQRDWTKAQRIIKDGVKFRVSGTRIFNNLPNPSDTEIFHLRPKAGRSAYYLPELEIVKGNIERDADILPNGDMMTKQSFWLNKDYIREQIEINKNRS